MKTLNSDTRNKWLMKPARLLASADDGNSSGHWLYNQNQEKNCFVNLLVCGGISFCYQKISICTNKQKT